MTLRSGYPPYGGDSRDRALATALLGLILWAIFLEQLWLQVEWPALRAWQSRFPYKIATGVALGAFLSFQWLLALCRVSGFVRAAKALHAWHQTMGALAPVFLFLHSTRLGFGYLVVLSGVYIANGIVGLVSPSAVPQNRSVMSAWTVAHISLSVLLAALAGYHAWTALYYE